MKQQPAAARHEGALCGQKKANVEHPGGLHLDSSVCIDMQADDCLSASIAMRCRRPGCMVTRAINAYQSIPSGSQNVSMPLYFISIAPVVASMLSVDSLGGIDRLGSTIMWLYSTDCCSRSMVCS